MHILESLALSNNLKIHVPEIYQKYYPLECDKYITIDITGIDDKEKYEHWKITLNLVHNFLVSKNIVIYQIGDNEQDHINPAISLISKLDLAQKAFILKNSLLHVGLNNLSCHIASSFSVKTLALFGSEFVNQSKPYWGQQHIFSGISPDSKFLPSQNANISEINKIKPEKIAQEILRFLGGYLTLEFQTLKIGRFFSNKKIESSMSSIVPNINEFGINSLICRMDYEFNEKVLTEQLRFCQCSIVTDKPIDLRIFKLFKERIIEVLYLVTEDADSSFVSEVNKLGIKINLSTYLSEDELKPLRLDFIDLPQNISILKINKELDLKDCYYKSSKFILHDGKMFTSRSAMKRNLFCEDFNHPFLTCFDEDEFWKDLEYFYIVKKEFDF